MRKLAFLLLLATAPLYAETADFLLARLSSPILLEGNATTAYRDPLLARINDKFFLLYSYVLTEPDQCIYWYTAWSTSTDLEHWTEPHLFTPKSQNLNYSSPGSLTRIGKDWVLALQTIPMNDIRMTDEKMKWPEDTSRLWTMRTKDFLEWSKPELLRVKGPNVAEKDMGRMIDPFLLEDKDTPGKWWCFFKQKSTIYSSTSLDLTNWTFNPNPVSRGENPEAIADHGDWENPEVIVDHGDYLMFYSPKNGTGVVRSHDGLSWHDDQPPITLGQKDWPWAQTRITAGYVADLRNVPGVGKYVFVCHSMGPGKIKTPRNVHANCNIVIGWSDDLRNWSWPGSSKGGRSPAASAAPRF
jgi:hypothetical protein